MNQDEIKQLYQNPIFKKLAEPSALDERYRQYNINQDRYNKQIRLNRHFNEGKQYYVLLPTSFELHEPIQDVGEVRIVINVIKRIINILQAEILARRPEPKAYPYGGDSHRIEAAEVMNQVLKQYQIDFERSGKMAQHILATWIDGYSFLTVEYHPDAGKVIDANPETQEPVREGKINIRLISSLDMLVPDDYPDINKAPCIIEVVRIHKEEAKQIFDLPNAPTPSAASELQRQRPDWNERSKDRDELVTVLKYYFLPGNGALPSGQGFDDGLCVIYLPESKIVADVQPFPFPYNEMGIYPILDFHSDRRVDHYHSQSVIEQLIPPQVELNRTWSQILTAKNFIGQPIWRYAQGQIIDPDEMPTYAGGQLVYNQVNGAPPPEPVTMPSIPAYIQEMTSRLESAMQGIHGTNDIAQAQQPGSVDSYSGLQLLSNIQAKVLTPYLTDYAAKLAVMFKVIGLMEQKYTDYEKQIRVTDDIGDQSIQSYYGADLLKDFDVVVQIESETESKAQKIQRSLQEVQFKIIDANEYKSRVYDEPENEVLRLEKIKHNRENDAMLQGQIVDNLPNVAFEDHVIGFEVNAKVLNDPRFKMLPLEIQTAHRKHIYIHFLGKTQPDLLYQQFVVPELQQLGIAPVQPALMPGMQPGQPQPQGGVQAPLAALPGAQIVQ